ncbi:MAG: galactosyldiacylglycerol synthase [Candidatus Riflebacteria bacterium]|nr:galactosyldiacylglycerol synthase [Candidatus Riflebacteria bacterium]
MGKPILAILSVSAGAGHVRAAEALKAAAEQHFPQFEPVHIDVMTTVGDIFRKLYAESYLSLVENHPSLWGILYKKADRQKADSSLNKLRRAVQRLNTRQFMARMTELNPDRVVCTHFLPAELLSRERVAGAFTKPVWVQVTDFDIHAMWIQSDVTGYFVANEEVAFRMADRGVARDTITVTGIPIMPIFGQPQNREETARELGLDLKRKTILMMSGGYGVGGIDLLVERLLKVPGDFQIIALAGRNEELLGSLKKLQAGAPGKLFPMGFTRTIERLMAVADFAVTKPGGLTTSECLAMGLPMVIVSPIPGQEERNADFLLESGVALKAYDGAGLEFRIAGLLQDPDRVKAMAARARALARPGAARAVLEKVCAGT